jgi:hypothetical protein
MRARGGGRQNGLEVIKKGRGDLIGGSGGRTIRVKEMGDFVFVVSFDDGQMEESSVSISLYGPLLFKALNVVGLFSG